MHQARQGRQVGDIEIVRLVEHQVAAHQAQHGRYLSPAALTLGGRGQVVDGADQYRRDQQGAHLGFVDHLVEQRMGVHIAVEAYMTIVFEQCLAGGRAAAFGERLLVLEQGTVGRATDANGQVILVQSKALAEGAPGLQGQAAQAKGEGTAHAALGVAQGIHDACIAQGLAATGGGHIDDERTVPSSLFAHAGGQVEGLVLPTKAFVAAALLQALVPAQAWQAALEVGQAMADQPGIGLDPQQMFVEALVELAAFALGIGPQRIVRLALHPAWAGETGIVVVGEHQVQACQVHQVGAA